MGVSMKAVELIEIMKVAFVFEIKYKDKKTWLVWYWDFILSAALVFDVLFVALDSSEEENISQHKIKYDQNNSQI